MKVYVVTKSVYIGDLDFTEEVDRVFSKREDAEAYVKPFPAYHPGKTYDIYAIHERELE